MLKKNQTVNKTKRTKPGPRLQQDERQSRLRDRNRKTNRQD